MKDHHILIRLRSANGSSVCRATRSAENKTYIAVHRNEQDEQLELRKLPRDGIFQEDERYLGVFHIHPTPSPIYFESFNCGTVTASRDGHYTKNDPYEPINTSPESFVLYEDDERPIVLYIDDYSIQLEKHESSSQDRTAMGILVENTDLQEFNATPKPARVPGALGNTIVGRDIQVSRSMEDLGSETEDQGSEGDNEDLLVKETQEEMVPSTEEHKLSTVARSRRAKSRTPQPPLPTKDDQDDETGMVDGVKTAMDDKASDDDTDMPDSLPPAFHKTSKQPTPRRTYKDRTRKKILDTQEEEELENMNVGVENEAEEASPTKTRPTRKTGSAAARSKRTRLSKDEPVEEDKTDKFEEPIGIGASAHEPSPKQDTPEETNARTSKRRKTATEKAKAVPDDKDSADADGGSKKNKPGPAGKRKRKGTDSVADDVSPAQSRASTPSKPMDPPKSKKEESTIKARGTRAASAALSSQGHTPQKTSFSGGSGDSAKPRTTKTFSGDIKSLKIIFSNSKLEDAKETAAFLRSKKIKAAHNVMDKDVRILVVGAGEIKKTSKLLLSIAMGKIIVDDQWLVDCQKYGEILDTQPYCPTDPVRETEWDVKFSEILQQDSNSTDQNLQILQDKSVFFTPAVKKHLQNASSFDDFKNMVTITGGTILTKLPKDMTENSCIVVSIDGDKENKKYTEGGRRIYKTDLITFSVLRGVLDMENEEYML